MQFSQRVGDQMAPLTTAPFDPFCININRHGARLGKKNVQIFCTHLAKYSIKMNASELGKCVKAVRKRKGFTLKHLQERTGVHYTQISKMERGDCKLLSKNLQKICDFLHISSAAGITPVGSESVVDQVQALIRSWPQSEGVIRHFLEGVEMALAGGHVR
ncbi:helix-turn-helix transcriptional regulator [Pseudomonas alliivorans]|nr:helix-turn-helix transcriptional regulator [Pseudomonas alliivorans]MEE4701971.1 helix-turn-helix transcriptional regulator [Pseudomonas alliivorans]